MAFSVALGALYILPSLFAYRNVYLILLLRNHRRSSESVKIPGRFQQRLGLGRETTEDLPRCEQRALRLHELLRPGRPYHYGIDFRYLQTD